MFGEGNVVILQSCASGKTLRINQAGNVEGIGGQGLFAQFRVHVRRPGVVALQNVHTPDNWLAIFQGNTIGTVCVVRFSCSACFLFHTSFSCPQLPSWLL